MTAGCARALLAVFVLALSAQPAAPAGDPAAAERQYRVARRLAAEGSAEAPAALRKVVELDPDGPLVDDALLEEALLGGLPRWPESLGVVDAAAADRALGLLDRILAGDAAADRADEARYYRGLLRLEPLRQHDAAAARLDLLTLATRREAADWRHDARYALAWLAEQQGDANGAGSAYQRIAIDAPSSDAARRAQVGLARLDLRRELYGPAATRLQAAADTGGDGNATAEALKKLALRGLLQGNAERHAGSVPTVVAQTGVRSLSGFAAAPDGGVVLADRREGAVIAFGPQGSERGRWPLAAPLAVAVSPLGRAYAASGDRIFRLVVAGAPLDVASQGEFAPISAMAVDALGAVWVADRRGENVGRVSPGAAQPSLVWSGAGQRLSAIAWDGRRLLATDGRGKRLLALGRDGSTTELTGETFLRPAALAIDPSGVAAVLDVKAGSILFFDANGTARGSFALSAAGIDRPAAVGLGPDGSLHLFDESTGAWMKVP